MAPETEAAEAPNSKNRVWQATPRQAEFLQAEEDEVLYGGAAGGGKMLDLRTSIPTPDGWKLMGELEQGDELFDEKGEVCRVVVAHPVEQEPESYRITFDDGSGFLACKDHKWLTYNARELEQLRRRDPDFREKRRQKRRSGVKGNKSKTFTETIAKRNKENPTQAKPLPTGEIRTTEQIAQTLTARGGRRNYAIPVSEAINLPERELPLDPYLLGCWLGDGCRNKGSITTADVEVVAAFTERGFPVAHIDGPDATAPTYRFERLRPILKDLGILWSKHVPAEYLRGSKQQRIALLQGLMDTDGTVCKESGSVEFQCCNFNIALAVHELIVSLGDKANINEGEAKLNGNYVGPKWRIKWKPDYPVFRLSRKAEYQQFSNNKRSNFRYIVDCKKTTPVPMRCITVDSESGLFLAGRNMVPTHNSDALLILCAYRCINVAGAHTLFLRTNFPDLEMSAIKRSLELFSGMGPTYDKQKKKWSFPNGSVLQFGYLERDDDVYRYHSAEFDLICFDEATLFSEFQYTYMMSRNRCSIPGVKAIMRLGSNPGGPGHLWMKQRFIDPMMPGETYKCPESGQTRRFIPAKVDDNPHVDPNYKMKLDQLPETRRKQLKEGDWDAAEGMAFPEFHRDIHVCKSFTPPAWWTRWRANDPGYTDPFAWYWFAVDPDGVIYVYREFTRSREDEKLVYSHQAAEVARRSKMLDTVNGETIDEEFEFTVVGRDAFTRHPETGKSIVDYYEEGGVDDCMQPPRDTNRTDRIFRKAVFHEYLQPYFDENTGQATAKLKIMDNCPKLIETLPGLVVDPKDPEKVADSSIDHWYDACLTADTEVETISGSVDIADLVGQKGWVHCFDEEKADRTLGWFHSVRQTGYKQVFEIGFEDGRSLKATEDHEVLTKRGWKQVKELNLEDEIIDIFLNFAKIKSIKPAGYQDVYNMEVEKHHNFAVNGGLIVHNCGYGLVTWHAQYSTPPKKKKGTLGEYKDKKARNHKIDRKRLRLY